MRIVFLLTLFISAFSLQGLAQDQLAEYKRAKTLMGYGNYADAMESFRPYMDSNKFGGLSNYASYHFAWSAYQNGQYVLAQTILKNISEQTSWAKKDETRYLLALAYFQEGKNIEALEEIGKIRSPEIKKQAENASYNFLQNVSVSFLMGNIRKFNDNKGFMLALKEKMEKQTIMTNEERAVYNQIKDIQTGGNQESSKESKNPQALDIAVILPFNYAGGTGVTNLGNGNFVFELYQGLEFAAKELKKSGLKLNIRTFDTERNLSKVQNILADPYLKQADIIIGPIYPDETEYVMAFAERNSIPFINPLSNVDDKMQGTNFSYLFRPSINSLSESIIQFSRKNNTGKRIAIAYSNTTRDELLAKNLGEKAQKNGFTVIRNQKVAGREIIDLFDQIQLKFYSAARADMVVVLSDDPDTASLVFGFMESQNIKTPVMVLDSWLFFNFANYEMLTSQNFRFIGNNTIRFDSKNLEGFRENFYKTYTNYPAFNTHLGYELMHWVAGTINPQKGFDFRKNLDAAGFNTGKITYGFDFNRQNNNTHVPVLRMVNGILEEN